MKLKNNIFYSFVILLCVISFLFSPKPEKFFGPTSQCPVKYISINRHIGFPMNCDAIEFTGASVNPSCLFQKGYYRQSRPLYILTGYIVGSLIYLITIPIHPYIEKFSQKRITEIKYQSNKKNIPLYSSHYLGLIIINFIILLTSCILLFKITSFFSGPWKNSRLLQLLTVLLLISNFVTKTYFWTPHQQMFNIFTPLFCINLAIHIYSKPTTFRKIFYTSLFSGLLPLYYGSFFLVLPTIIFTIIYKLRYEKKYRLSIVLKNIATSIIGFIIPLFFWVLLLKINGVEFSNAEIKEYRQFVWVYDALYRNENGLLNQLVSNFLAMLKTLAVVIFPLLFLIIVHLITTKSVHNFHCTKFQIRLFIFLGLLFFVFIYFIGYYADRLSYSFVPLITVIASIRFNRSKISQAKIYLICLIMILWHIFLIQNEMPHFSERYYY